MKQLVKHPLEDFLLRNKFKNIEGDFWQHEVFGLLILNQSVGEQELLNMIYNCGIGSNQDAIRKSLGIV